MLIAVIATTIMGGCNPWTPPSAGQAVEPNDHQFHSASPRPAPIAAVPTRPDLDPLDEPSPDRSGATIWSWGAGGVGMDGRADPLPDPLVGLTDVTAVAAGRGQSIAFKPGGRGWGWVRE